MGYVIDRLGDFFIHNILEHVSVILQFAYATWEYYVFVAELWGLFMTYVASLMAGFTDFLRPIFQPRARSITPTEPHLEA